MTEPVTTNATTAAVGVALVSLFPGLNAAVVMGAFAGAGVFVLSSDDLPPFKRVLFFLISFVAGCIAAHLCADLISFELPGNVTANPAVGALVASSVSIKLLLWFIARVDDPGSIIKSFKGGPKS